MRKVLPMPLDFKQSALISPKSTSVAIMNSLMEIFGKLRSGNGASHSAIAPSTPSSIIVAWQSVFSSMFLTSGSIFCFCKDMICFSLAARSSAATLFISEMMAEILLSQSLISSESPPFLRRLFAFAALFFMSMSSRSVGPSLQNKILDWHSKQCIKV